MKRLRIGYQRRISPASQFSIREYAALTAEAIWAWNRLQSTLSEIFAALVSDRDVAYAIWHTIQNDSTQRELLLATANARFPKNRKITSKVNWLIKTQDRYAPLRNAVVHTPLYFRSMGDAKPHAIILDADTARRVAIARLEAIGSGQRFWNSFAGDLFVLGQYSRGLLHLIQHTMSGQTPEALLEKPRLLCLQRMAEVDRQIAPPQPRKARKRQLSAARRKPRSS